MTHLALPRSNDRLSAVEFVKAHAPWAEENASLIKGGKAAADRLMTQINAPSYSKTRNHLDGTVTRLSPYIRHGVISANTIRNHVLRSFPKAKSERFLQQLAWRDYWQRLYRANPDWIWNSVENYKTGFRPSDYVDGLPDDILNGETGIATIDHFIHTLTSTGWLHNYARLHLGRCLFSRARV